MNPYRTLSQCSQSYGNSPAKAQLQRTTGYQGIFQISSDLALLCTGVSEGASDVDAFAAIRKAKDNF